MCRDKIQIESLHLVGNQLTEHWSYSLHENIDGAIFPKVLIKLIYLNVRAHFDIPPKLHTVFLQTRSELELFNFWRGMLSRNCWLCYLQWKVDFRKNPLNARNFIFSRYANSHFSVSRGLNSSDEESIEAFDLDKLIQLKRFRVCYLHLNLHGPKIQQVLITKVILDFYTQCSPYFLSWFSPLVLFALFKSFCWNVVGFVPCIQNLTGGVLWNFWWNRFFSIFELNSLPKFKFQILHRGLKLKFSFYESFDWERIFLIFESKSWSSQIWE